MAPIRKKKTAPANKASSRKAKPEAKLTKSSGPHIPVEELEKESLAASRNGRNAPEKDI